MGKDRKQINIPLPILEDYGLVRKVGSAERSGLYEITVKGKAALRYQNQYGDGDDSDELIERPDSETGSQNGSVQASFARGDEEEQDNT